MEQTACELEGIVTYRQGSEARGVGSVELREVPMDNTGGASPISHRTEVLVPRFVPPLKWKPSSGGYLIVRRRYTSDDMNDEPHVTLSWLSLGHTADGIVSAACQCQVLPELRSVQVQCQAVSDGRGWKHVSEADET